MPYSKEQLEEMAQSVDFWWHSIDLGQGVTTKGFQSASHLAKLLQSLQLPNLQGKSVLDIGAYDGFYSFEAERRGAKRVLALDHYVWSLDLPAHIEYWKECKERGIVPEPYHQTPHWLPSELPGKRGYDTAHRALDSKVETKVSDFMEMDLNEIGTFDVVFFLGVLYHLENPLAALRRVAAVTKEMAVIETAAMEIQGYEHVALCEFYESDELNGDVSNWWAPNEKALAGMCRAAGFKRVETVRKPDRRRVDTKIKSGMKYLFSETTNVVKLETPNRLKPNVFQSRAAVHAWK